MQKNFIECKEGKAVAERGHEEQPLGRGGGCPFARHAKGRREANRSHWDWYWLMLMGKEEGTERSGTKQQKTKGANPTFQRSIISEVPHSEVVEVLAEGCSQQI